MGIDYGNGKTNIDPETKIRYGVISQNSVLQAWCDSSEAQYPCSDCEHDEDGDCGCYDLYCEPSGFIYEEDGYIAESCFDNMEIMILKSPFFTAGNFCSPCVPGGIDLDSPAHPSEADDIAYCFGHDWFEGNKAPYRVFSVETGKEVLPD